MTPAPRVLGATAAAHAIVGVVGALSQVDVSELMALEKSLWRAETRFDPAYLELVLAADFVEFGRSGRVYTRDGVLAASRQNLDATLRDLAVHQVADDVALLTYVSEVRYDEVEGANRSSLWFRDSGRWLLRFHQGTPLPPLEPKA